LGLSSAWEDAVFSAQQNAALAIPPLRTKRRRIEANNPLGKETGESEDFLGSLKVRGLKSWVRHCHNEAYESLRTVPFTFLANAYFKVSWFLSTCNGLLALFALTIDAWPFHSSLDSSTQLIEGTLQARQAGTHNGHDNSRSGYAGTFHCYKGGTWMAQSQINNTLDQACTTTDFDHDAQHFNFTLDTTNGTNAIQEIRHDFRHCGNPQQFGVWSSECSPPDQAYVNYAVDFKTTTYNNTEACRFAMRRILAHCYGKHQDTRGGWWQFDQDSTTYNVDPQTVSGGIDE